MRKVLSGLCLLLIVSLATSVFADEAKSKFYTDIKANKQANSERINSTLRDVFARIRTERDKAKSSDEFSNTFVGKKYSNPLVRVNDSGNIQVYIQLNTINRSILNELKKNNIFIEIVNKELKLIQAWIYYDDIEKIADLPFVRSVRPPDYSVSNSGSYMTEGAAILLAEKMNELGFDGGGAKIGVISDGVNNLNDAVVTEDLPLDITVFGSCTMSGDCNEGTAMLEIIHDLAPAAQLAFGAGGTSLSFIDRLNDLANIFGANIIVDDLLCLGESYFEDGAVAQAVKSLVDKGILYVSAAGNYAQKHYQGNFVGANYFDPVIPNHDFGSLAGGVTDLSMDIVLNGGENITVRLQWNDAFGASTNDYDLYLLSGNEVELLGKSVNAQDGDGDPYEALTFTNPLVNQLLVKIFITKYSGADRLLKMFILGGAPLEYVVPEGSIFGHPAVPGVVSVAAIAANDPNNDDIEPFSSRGPVEIFYPSEETRNKPDLTGIDNVEVSGVGGFASPFLGTSAAAPHIAGLAALLYGPFSTSAQEIITALKDSAVDLGTAGFDFTFGSGRANAYEAAKLLNKAPVASIDKPISSVTITKGETVNFVGTCTDVNGGQNTYLWGLGADSGIVNQNVEDPGNLKFEQAGTFNVTFNCTDVFGVSQTNALSRTITVNNPPVNADNPPSGSNNSPASDNNSPSDDTSNNSPASDNNPPSDDTSNSNPSASGGCSLIR